MSEHKIIDLSALARAKANGAHSIFGASGSPLYLNCPGGLIPNILALDQAGPDAAYGTVAHFVTEQWLLSGREPVHLIGTKQVVGDDIDTCHLVEIDDEIGRAHV